MNFNWIKYIIYFVVIVGLLVSGALINRCSNKPDYKESNSNLIAQDSSREILYSTEEVQALLADHDSALLSKLKPKTIYRVLKLKLDHSDSVRIANYFKPEQTIEQDLLIDTNYDVRFFDIEKDCYTINGVSYPDTTIINTNFSTEITTVLYQKYKYDTFFKRLIHLSWKSYNDAVSIMNCNGQELKVQNNIQVVRRK